MNYVNQETGEILTKEEIKKELMLELAKTRTNKEEGLIYLKSKEELNQFIDQEFGKFFFNNYKKTLEKFINTNGKYESAMAFRFLYLSSFMDYDGKLKFGAKFRDSHRAFMVEKDLQEVLKLSERETRNTKNFLFELGVLKKDEDGILMIDETFCKKGETTKAYNKESTRIFDNTIRKLYEQSKSTEHKKLGLFVRLIPYINFKYNIICYNPKEETEKYIKPMDMKQICDIVGYNNKNSARLKRELFSIKVDEKFVVGNFETGAGNAFVINPSVFYAGNNIEDLKWLNSLFKIVE